MAAKFTASVELQVLYQRNLDIPIFRLDAIIVSEVITFYYDLVICRSMYW